MIVGIPKEIKTEEHRVAMTPAGVEVMKLHGHTVLVEENAGMDSGFSNSDYTSAGAEIIKGPTEIYARSDMVMHVKEPLPSEYELIRKDQIIFTFLHLAASEELTKVLIKARSVNIAYETIQKSDGSLPLLTPMSEVAGRMAIQQAAWVACGFGARVYVLDINLARLRYLSDMMPPNCIPLMSHPATLRELVKEADVLVGAVLIPGARAPALVTRDMLKTMKKGSVIVDVAIDQGGCFETSRPTTHNDPIYTVDGIVHYCVANMPGGVAKTATRALTNATLPYALEIANKGWQKAFKENPEIKLGANVVAGKVTCKGVADAFGLEYVSIDRLL